MDYARPVSPMKPFPWSKQEFILASYNAALKIKRNIDALEMGIDKAYHDVSENKVVGCHHPSNQPNKGKRQRIHLVLQLETGTNFLTPEPRLNFKKSFYFPYTSEREN